jgi:hypothetical protein
MVQVMKPTLSMYARVSSLLGTAVVGANAVSSALANRLTAASGPLSRNPALRARSLGFLLYCLASHIRLLVPPSMPTLLLLPFVLLAGSGKF